MNDRSTFVQHKPLKRISEPQTRTESNKLASWLTIRVFVGWLKGESVLPVIQRLRIGPSPEGQKFFFFYSYFFRFDLDERPTIIYLVLTDNFGYLRPFYPFVRFCWPWWHHSLLHTQAYEPGEMGDCSPPQIRASSIFSGDFFIFQAEIFIFS